MMRRVALLNAMIRARTSQIKAAQRLSSRAFSSSYAGNNVLGILREDFGMWERRAPLSPNQVSQLMETNPGVKVLVQPCTRRVFSNIEYEKAGAVISEDLKEASFLIGVKSPKANTLIPNKSYMFFSHTIKAQPYSMPLLDTILKNNIRLYDYECITQGGRDDTPRTVAFGAYAGRAGMIDGLQGLGLRLLAEGYSTPFLHLPTTYMHQNWEQAQEAVRKMGELISKNGLPKELTPLVFAFTGKGNVAKGAKEVFEHLPHEYITAKELPSLKADVEAGRRPANKVYGVLVETSDIAQLKGQPDAPFDRTDFQHNPSKYEGKFHRTVLPHIHMLVNGVYWEDRFPRVVTKQQVAHLRSPQGGNNRNLRVVADISCDYQGSVEFLEKFTTIEDPYFTYNPEAAASKEGKAAITDKIDGSGILVLGVDNLPSELPRDASEHFGAALLPLIPPILQSKGDAELSDLPAELRRACLASGGDYRPKWSYIARLREQAEHAKAAQAAAGRGKTLATMKIELVGHLFDTGLVNQVLDLLEASSKEVPFAVTDCDVRPNNSSGAQYSRFTLELSSEDKAAIQAVVDRLNRTVEKTPKAEASINVTKELSTVTVAGSRRVLLFGSGRVAKPLMKLLDSLGDVEVVIATEDEAQAQDLMSAMGTNSVSGNRKASFVKYRYPDDNRLLPELINKTDVVVSLLPATMHVPIAQESINQGRHMVTASYVSPEMKALDAAAKAKGVVMLNEVGLDPGIDHALIMQSVDSIHQRGGTVTELVSLCGGLPDPVAADNPLRYKMSWSPRGVLNAAGNSARYLSHGQVITVPGEELLLSTLPTSRIPTLRLEVIPNRDSLSYRELYGVPDVHSICRGTLRYEGWANSMHALKAIGLFDKSEVPGLSIDDLHAFLARAFPDGRVTEASMRKLMANRGVRDIDGAMEAVRWLGLMEPSKPTAAASAAAGAKPVAAIDALCKVLEARLQYKEGEKDMVAMFHTVTGEMPDGSVEAHTSRLLAFGTPGGDSAMSATVGYTTAAGVELVLQRLLPSAAEAAAAVPNGVIIPTMPSVYEPILKRISDFGITWTEDLHVSHKQRK